MVVFPRSYTTKGTRPCAARDRRYECTRPPGRHPEVVRTLQHCYNADLRSPADAAGEQPNLQDGTQMTTNDDTVKIRALKQALFNHYGQFADKRIKNIDRGNLFIADDRGPGDYAADKSLFLWFCSIFAEVIDGNTLKVSMRGGVPKGAAVAAWIKKHAAVSSDESLTFTVTSDDVSKLTELAAAFRSIVSRGAPRYAEKAYKYVCPRTAAALDALGKVLGAHWA